MTASQSHTADLYSSGGGMTTNVPVWGNFGTWFTHGSVNNVQMSGMNNHVVHQDYNVTSDLSQNK